ncbi:MAG: DNA-directed RNA polymerase subunit L [Ferroplasma sp.]
MECKFEIVSRNKDSIKVEMINYDNTLLRPLAEELLKYDKVVESYYSIKHPEIDNPVIYVKVSSGKPQSAIKSTIRKMNKTYEALSNDLAKGLQKYTSVKNEK